jgi:MGT family glycosyltransferase
MLPLGKALQERGHTVTLIGVADAQDKTLAAGLNFQVIGEEEMPAGSMAESLAKLGTLSGRQALNYTVNLVRQSTEALLREAPSRIETLGIDALIVDQVSPAGGTVANYLQLPFVSLCSALILNREINIPPYFTTWPYQPNLLGQLRNRLGYRAQAKIVKPVTEVINRYRQAWHLPIQTSPNDRYSGLAQISQQPSAFEFPRQELPAWFHFTGPYHNATGRPTADFPWEQLTGQPLIYASLGTIQHGLIEIFQRIAEACVGLDAQLVLSLGGATGIDSLPTFPGNPLVCRYVPQLEILKKASLVITHAGLNTTLEALSNGVPLVALPIANDQPGVAARIAWSGCGEFIPVKQVTVPKLASAIRQVLENPNYRQQAQRLQKDIQLSGGLSQAVNIIEQAVSTGQPVINPLLPS